MIRSLICGAFVVTSVEHFDLALQSDLKLHLQLQLIPKHVR